MKVNSLKYSIDLKLSCYNHTIILKGKKISLVFYISTIKLCHKCTELRNTRYFYNFLNCS